MVKEEIRCNPNCPYHVELSSPTSHKTYCALLKILLWSTETYQKMMGMGKLPIKCWKEKDEH